MRKNQDFLNPSGTDWIVKNGCWISICTEPINSMQQSCRQCYVGVFIIIFFTYQKLYPKYNGFVSHQKFDEPETGFVVGSFEGVDEEEHHEAVEDEGVRLHRDPNVVRKQTGQDAETPQHPQKPSNLQKVKRKKDQIEHPDELE